MEEDLSTEDLLEMYKLHSGGKLHRLRPDVWTSHGQWTRAYKHLDGVYTKERKGPGGSSGVVTNRPFIQLFSLNSTDVQIGLVEMPSGDYQRIVVAFTRASSAPPTYGAQGMFDRGATAAKAWATLRPDLSSLLVSLPRARVASKWPLSEKRSLVGEMISVLDAAADGMGIDLLSVGIDGLTTDLASLEWTYETWGHRLHLRLVVVVPSGFDGSQLHFPTLASGIRYGTFELSELYKVLRSPQEHPNAKYDELVDLISRIRRLKDNRENGYMDLGNLTSGRANFRVCPVSQFDSGADEDSLRQSRSLH